MNAHDRLAAAEQREWLEADGLGGFASMTAAATRTRRYHGLLCVATRPPVGRVMLVNAVEVWLDTPSGSSALSSHRYLPDVVHPDGHARIESFTHEPWPTWTLRVRDDVRVRFEVFVPRGESRVALAWKLLDPLPGARLRVRPLLSVRDVHELLRESRELDLAATSVRDGVSWTPRVGRPSIVCTSNGGYRHEPLWYRDFLQVEERARGYDHVEDLASPGELSFDLSGAEARVEFATAAVSDDAEFERRFDARRLSERARRAAIHCPLERAGQSYVVRRGTGLSIVAGYPWFGDWGRDTFIALRGLCTATGRHDQAASILLEWSEHVSQGQLPNRFVESGETAEYNSVDSSLWFVVAAGELLERATLQRTERKRLTEAILAIVGGLSRGSRFGIRVDDDGLLAAGAPGSQLTWMDARVGEREITPRIGKPVEIQALWLNTLHVTARFDARHRGALEHALESFQTRFWNEERGELFDVVDVDHVAGRVDASSRPNQVLAIGGLPLQLVDGERARRIVDNVERRLLTPLGLRSLAADDPQYRGRYEGGVDARDEAYHQGSAWPWLVGPFVEAWVRVRGSSASARRSAMRRFVRPLLAHLEDAGLAHVSEIADGDAPHTPRGCPFQAWSLGELLRLERDVLAEKVARPGSLRGRVARTR